MRSNSANITGLFKKIKDHLTVEAPKGAPYTDRHMVVICMTPRSGSSYLGSALEANGIANVSEHFRIQGGAIENEAAKLAEKDYEFSLRHKIERLTSATGFFGVKADWPQYAPIYAMGYHNHYFARAKFFYLSRSDVLAQAISRYIATESNYFHSVNALPASGKIEVGFDYDKIAAHMEHLIAMQGDWERFFASEGIRPDRIFYEDIERDPASVIKRIVAELGETLDEVRTETEYKVVRTGLNDCLKEAFVDEHRRRVSAHAWH